jgi:hypothetical protein
MSIPYIQKKISKLFDDCNIYVAVRRMFKHRSNVITGPPPPLPKKLKYQVLTEERVDEIGSMLEHSPQKSLTCLVQIRISRTKLPERTSICECNTFCQECRHNNRQIFGNYFTLGIICNVLCCTVVISASGLKSVAQLDRCRMQLLLLCSSTICRKPCDDCIVYRRKSREN